MDTLVPGHLAEVRQGREVLVAKTMAVVKERLTTEIAYWDRGAEELKGQEAAGRQLRMNWQRSRQRADDLQAHLQQRMKELEQERHLSLPPVAIGGALIVPAGLLVRLQGQAAQAHVRIGRDTDRVEHLAMAAVMTAERRLGFEPQDSSGEKRGHDTESWVPGTGRLHFIEVKGRAEGAQVVTITKNRILANCGSTSRTATPRVS